MTNQTEENKSKQKFHRKHKSNRNIVDNILLF